MELSAVIITFNEQKNIRRCILSVKDVADEIIVVDSFSSDKTEEICLSLGVTFIKQQFLGYIEQKNFAIQQAKNTYVLSLDADEALSQKAKEEILKIKSHYDCDAYSFNRLTNYCNEGWIRHCGWYPDTKVRLWNKEKGAWGGTNPHDAVIMQQGANIKHLSGDILHYSYTSTTDHINQLNHFTTIGAQECRKKGKSCSIFLILLKTHWKFIRDYFFKGGFLDGWQGFRVCYISSFATFIKYVKLKEQNDNQEHTN